MEWYLSEFEAGRRHDELLKEAQTSRMLAPKVPGTGSRRSRNRAMYWLGSRLVESGRRLQLL
jgi:hypothetical protein